MIRSLFKIIKNQLGQNILPGIFICFVTVLLFYVVDFSVTYTRLYNVPNGADPGDCYALHIDRLNSNTLTGDSLWESYDRMTRQIITLPGVADYSISGFAYPYTNWMWNGNMKSGELESKIVYYRFVDHAYASMFSLPLQEGRWFTPEEIANKEYVGVVSADVARDLAPDGGSLLGRYVDPDFNEPDSFRVIGVVAGVKENDFDRPPRAMYIPLGHFNAKPTDARIPQLVIRVPKANEMEFAPAFDNFVVHYLPGTGFNISFFSPVASVRESNNSRISNELSLYAMGATFFLINILLAIFGTFTFRMKRRVGEMGVRMALGSTKWGLFSYVVGEALLLTSVCLAISLVICLNIVNLDLLVTALPVTALRVAGSFIITSAIILLAIFLSVYIPARKAAKIAPAEALHYE